MTNRRGFLASLVLMCTGTYARVQKALWNYVPADPEVYDVERRIVIDMIPHIFPKTPAGAGTRNGGRRRRQDGRTHSVATGLVGMRTPGGH